MGAAAMPVNRPARRGHGERRSRCGATGGEASTCREPAELCRNDAVALASRERPGGCRSTPQQDRWRPWRFSIWHLSRSGTKSTGVPIPDREGATENPRHRSAEERVHSGRSSPDARSTTFSACPQSASAARGAPRLAGMRARSASVSPTSAAQVLTGWPTMSWLPSASTMACAWIAGGPSMFQQDGACRCRATAARR